MENWMARLFESIFIPVASSVRHATSWRFRSDFDTCFRNLLPYQPLMDRRKAVGTTDARFGQFSPVYGSDDWSGEEGGGWALIRIIGGSATPTAWNTAPEQPGAAARRRSLLPA